MFSSDFKRNIFVIRILQVLVLCLLWPIDKLALSGRDETQTLLFFLFADVMIFLLASEVLKKKKKILPVLFFPLVYKKMISSFVLILVWARGRKLIRIWDCDSERRVIITQGCVAFPTVILSHKHAWAPLSVL